MNREFSRKIPECSRDSTLRLHADCQLLDIIKHIRVTGLCCRDVFKIRHILYNSELNLSARSHIGKNVMNDKTTGNDFKRIHVSTRSTFIDNLITIVIEAECQYCVLSGEKLELVTAHSVFGCLIISGTEHESLGNLVAFILKHDLNLCCLMKIIQLRNYSLGVPI